jgi:Tfp pilus assembly protein PilF
MAAHSRAIAEAARSLAPEQVKGSFLGCEVREKTQSESMLDDAWKALDRGELDAAVALTSTLLAKDATNEKTCFTRALAYARQGEWRYAAADYSQYLKLQQSESGPTLGEWNLKPPNPCSQPVAKSFES